ncbi:DUF7224 domain-containing protein [Streptomyces sp. NPDC055036]
MIVAFSVSTDPPWLRHVSGQYTDLAVGELPSPVSLAAPVLMVGGIAVGVALMWLPVRVLLVRVVLACCVAVSGSFAAYDLAHGWSYNPPLLTGQVPMACLGNTPKVCMPKAMQDDLPAVRKDALSVLEDLRDAGAIETPSIITDRLVDGRFARSSTAHTWRIGLTSAFQNANVRYQVMSTAVRFPCTNVDTATGHAVLLWAATVTGETEAYKKRMAQEIETAETLRMEKEVQKVVAGVLSDPRDQQAAWFRKSLNDACSRDNA